VSKPFWADGLRFECQGTGRCCTSRGEHGFVYLTREDRRRLAAHLGMTTAAFRAEHCGVTDGELHLKDPDKDCQFLDGKRCGVYEARPTQCRTWPFWPETMNARAWRKDVESFCPGVGKGRLYEKSEIEALVQLGKISTRS
jgi:uncharacterized protein